MNGEVRWPLWSMSPTNPTEAMLLALFDGDQA